MDAPDQNICPSCNQPLPPDSPLGQLCPQCLVKSGFYSGTAPSDSFSAEQRKFPAPAVDALQPHFPQLEIIELIGRGGMGAVYKARQPKLNRLVALKILAREDEADARFTERFQREAQALAHMNHPNIVTVYDFGEAGGYYYLLMEFVDGLNLRQVEQSKKLAPEEALAIVPPICDALQYAHSQGVVHRDIKPENILLDKEGRVKIADFGIAKILGADPGEPLTGDEHRVGTPHYMAPEQVERPAAVDHRADIYSLGVVFYEMLTGELPLGRFAAPSNKVQIDVRLDAIVLRALEKEPELRYQQASEIKTQVETLSSEADSPDPADNGPKPGDDAAALALAESSKKHQLQSLLMGGVTMIIMLALGSRITTTPDTFFWWNVGFGVGLVSICVRYFQLRNTPASELAAAQKTILPDRRRRAFAQFFCFLTALFIFVNFFRRLQAQATNPMTEHELYMSMTIMLVLTMTFVVLGLLVRLQPGGNPERVNDAADVKSPRAMVSNDPAQASHGVLAAALTVVWIYAWLTGVLVADVGVKSMEIFLYGTGLAIVGAPLVFALAMGAATRWMGNLAGGGSTMFRANSVLGINLSLAVLIAGGLSLYALTEELQSESGWNPAPTELAVFILLWLGMLLVPWATLALLKAGNGGGRGNKLDYRPDKHEQTPAFPRRN